ncbi:hypothetical protein Q9R34_12675 [Enterobacter sp. BRE11]|nr:hypothetical protein [Enterobacter sp. BRE11]
MMSKLTAEWCKWHIESMKANGMSLLEEKYLEALEIALPVLEQQEKGDDAWIEWGGGKCPVDGNANVELKLRNGCFGGGIRKAGGYYWGHSKTSYDSDIIAYRVVQQERERGEEE